MRKSGVYILKIFDLLIFPLVYIHHHWVYNAINRIIEPFICNHPGIPYLTPNRVTFFRTALLLPAVFTLTQGHYFFCAILIFCNDLLDFVDGIIARAHKKIGVVYDAIFGAYFDAVCDKIFSISVWYAWIVLALNQRHVCLEMNVVFLLIVLESSLFWIRTKIYFTTGESSSVFATQNGKAKQTLQMLGTVLLVLDVPGAVFVLLVCLPLTIRSIMEKILSESKNTE